ncbi:YhjD/YihY/BrkB family envelope integrity protein, partial [Microbacterium sp.]|uniref:YhjD/YihY/BrkB family envelope integrity protein n=1 Tax=Microbacterium sp. TaxID=51671 RepID=UPI003A86EB86
MVTDSTRPGVIARLIAWSLQRSIVRAYLRYSQQHGSMLADSVTYRTLFSVFAGVLLGFSVAALWLAGDPVAWQALVGALDEAIPGLVGEGGLIRLDGISAPAGLSVAGLVSLVGLIGAGIGAIGSMRLAIRQLAGTAGDDVAFAWVLLRNLGLALGAALLLVLSAAATMLGTAGLGMVADALGLPHDDPLITLASRAVAVVVTFALDAVVIAALFRVLSGLRPRAWTLWSGALLGAAGLTV